MARDRNKIKTSIKGKVEFGVQTRSRNRASLSRWDPSGSTTNQTGLFVPEDLAAETLDKQSRQMEMLKEARRAGKIANFVLDKLIVRTGLSDKFIFFYDGFN